MKMKMTTKDHLLCYQIGVKAGSLSARFLSSSVRPSCALPIQHGLSEKTKQTKDVKMCVHGDVSCLRVPSFFLILFFYFLSIYLTFFYLSNISSFRMAKRKKGTQGSGEGEAVVGKHPRIERAEKQAKAAEEPSVEEDTSVLASVDDAGSAVIGRQLASPRWKNRQRTLVFSSRGVSYRARHLMTDVCTLHHSIRADDSLTAY